MADQDPMQGVIPYLAMGGRAGEAIDFYKRALGATEIARIPMPDDQPGLMHGQVVINGGPLMLSDGTGGGKGDAPARMARFGHLQLIVANGRDWWDRAIGAGCTEVMPHERQVWGDEWGLVRDPFAIRWGIRQNV